MRILWLSLLLPMMNSAVNKYKIKRPTPSKELIEQKYKDVSGFIIDPSEIHDITEKGGNATYGEITYESMRQLLDEMKPTKKDVFYDLGCGVGKTCIQVVIDTPIKKAVGIELSPTRVQLAQKVQKQLDDDGTIPDGKKLIFKKENIADTDLSDATIVFICSTCFSPELMQTLNDKFEKLEKGLRVITLKVLPDAKNFKLIKDVTLAMSWSPSSPVYIYELQK